MVGSRTLTATVGLVGSLILSVLLWWYFQTLLVFLFLPFVPFLFRGLGGSDRNQPPRRTCPQCGFETRTQEYEYCPRDGRRLRKDDTTEETDHWQHEY